MPEEVYRQQWVHAAYDGMTLQGMSSGASVNIRPRGGEVDLTEGTDGSDVNLATDQGIEVEITLRETATTHEMLYQKHVNQGRGGPGCTLQMWKGDGRILTVPNAFVGMPGDLSTGDKMQGTHTYRFVGNKYKMYG